jgi:hypothetical protein
MASACPSVLAMKTGGELWRRALQVGKDGTRSGWLSDNGAALAAEVGAVDWRVADCGPGDIVVLGEYSVVA